MSLHAFCRDARSVIPFEHLHAKLIAISALYRYDTAEGIRITLTPDIGELESYFQIIKDSYDELWRDAVSQSKEQVVLANMFKELKRIGKKKRKSLRLSTSIAVVGAIYTLESIDVLKPDQSNGIQFRHVPVN